MNTTTAYPDADARRLQRVARAVRAGIVEVGLDASGDYYCDRAREILGHLPGADTTGWPPFADLVHPEDVAKLSLGALLEGTDADAFSQALRVRRADGTHIWVGVSGSYVRDGANRAVRLVATLTDISARKAREAQAQSRAKFIDDVVDLMPLEVAARDAVGRFMLVNRAWEQAARRKREQVIGKTAFELFPAHQAQSMQDSDSEALQLGGRTVYSDVRVRELDERSRYLAVSKTAMLDTRGRAVGVLATAADITARREAEQALKTEQQRLSLVIQVAQAGVLDWDVRGSRVYYSERLKEMLGYPADADTSAWPGMMERVHPDEYQQVKGSLVAYLRGSDGLESAHRTAEYRVRRADGVWLWVASRGMGQRDAAGRVVRYIATISDITEVKRREAELRDQIKLTADLIEGTPIPLYLKDTERRFVEVNAAFVRHSGIPVERTIGRTALEIVPTERSLRYDEQDRELLARGEGSNAIEVEIPRADGPHHYIMNKSVLRRSDGSVRGLVGTITEVTRLKRVEAELRASREEALQAARAKAAFLATMSHEIRTPLNGVIGMTGVLLDTALTREQLDYVETIRVSGETLLSVINDILDFSKIESGKLELEQQPLEIARVIEQGFDILGERARSKGLELLYEIDDDVPSHVYGDSTYLRQIVVNLAGNAVKFTDAGEVFVSVHVCSEAADGSLAVEFRVRDTGIGIPADRVSFLFEAFTQADTSTTRRYGGTGLGLAICKRLVELMGGTIGVASEPGRGSTFTFTIRCRTAPTPAEADARAGLGRITGKHILIVDDNASNLRILEHQLKRWGLRARPAAAGAAALDLIAAGERFDAAIVDYQMPEMDGVTLARAMRRQAACAAMPIILLSSSALRQARGAALFAARLLKPTRHSQLFDALATALTGRRVSSRAAAPAAAPEPILARDLPLSVLVVDDNDVNRKIALLLLRKFGYRADTAANGRQALEAVGRKRYNIVFMDVQMPEMDGYEATRAIGESQGEQRPVVVAMTASAMEGDRERCLAAGMNDYLRKPLETAALRGVLERWGGHARHPAMDGALAAGTQDAGAAGPIAVDWSRLEEIGRFDNARGSLLRKVLAAFTGQGKSRILAIKRAVARRDADQVAHAAHALKGAALNVGAVALAEVCGNVEQSARNGRTTELAPLMTALSRRFDEAARLLDKDGRKKGLPGGAAPARKTAKRPRRRARGR